MQMSTSICPLHRSISPPIPPPSKRFKENEDDSYDIQHQSASHSPAWIDYEGQEQNPVQNASSELQGIEFQSDDDEEDLQDLVPILPVDPVLQDLSVLFGNLRMDQEEEIEDVEETLSLDGGSKTTDQSDFNKSSFSLLSQVLSRGARKIRSKEAQLGFKLREIHFANLSKSKSKKKRNTYALKMSKSMNPEIILNDLLMTDPLEAYLEALVQNHHDKILLLQQKINDGRIELEVLNSSMSKFVECLQTQRNLKNWLKIYGYLRVKIRIAEISLEEYESWKSGLFLYSNVITSESPESHYQKVANVIRECHLSFLPPFGIGFKEILERKRQKKSRKA